MFITKFFIRLTIKRLLGTHCTGRYSYKILYAKWVQLCKQLFLERNSCVGDTYQESKHLPLAVGCYVHHKSDGIVL